MLIKIILILILLILSALTSGSEVAFFALEKSMLSDDKAGGLIEKEIAGSGIYKQECGCKKTGDGMYLNPYMGRRYKK